MYINFLLGLFSYVVLVIGVLIGVAFLTLLERRVLSVVGVLMSWNFVGFFSHLLMVLSFLLSNSDFLLCLTIIIIIWPLCLA